MDYENVKKLLETKLANYSTLIEINKKSKIEIIKEKINNPMNVKNIPEYNYKINIVFTDIIIKENILSIINDLSSIYQYSNTLKNSNIPPFVHIIFINSNITFNDKVELPWYIIFNDCNINIYINKDVNIVSITDSNFNQCTFTNITFVANNKPIKVNQLTIRLKNQKVINQLVMQYVIFSENDNKVEIQNTEIISMSLSALNTNVLFKLTNINNQDSSKQENFFIDSCTFNNKFLITKSKFKNSFTLINVSFNDAVSFEGSEIKEIDLSEIFFKSLISIEFSGITIIDLHSINRNTFRKIKHFLEVDNNKIEANRFHSYEMESKQRELRDENISTANVMDKFIFFFNKQVSNHGLNWMLPIFWILIIGFYFSSIYYSNYLNKDILILSFIFPISSLIFLSKMEFNDIGRYFLSLLPSMIFYFYVCFLQVSPDYKILFKFLNITNFSETQSVGVFISKIIMAYLIYHLLVAFRKDTRR